MPESTGTLKCVFKKRENGAYEVVQSPSLNRSQDQSGLGGEGSDENTHISSENQGSIESRGRSTSPVIQVTSMPNQSDQHDLARILQLSPTPPSSPPAQPSSHSPLMPSPPRPPTKEPKTPERNELENINTDELIKRIDFSNFGEVCSYRAIEDAAAGFNPSVEDMLQALAQLKMSKTGKQITTNTETTVPDAQANALVDCEMMDAFESKCDKETVQWVLDNLEDPKFPINLNRHHR